MYVRVFERGYTLESDDISYLLLFRADSLEIMMVNNSSIRIITVMSSFSIFFPKVIILIQNCFRNDNHGSKKVNSGGMFQGLHNVIV